MAAKLKESFPKMSRGLVLGVTNTSGNNILINWDEDKVVTKTHDQPIQALSSFAPFGVRRERTLGTRL